MIELRFFGGLSVEETATVLKVSVETVMRDWKLAKVWLLRELRSDTADPHAPQESIVSVKDRSSRESTCAKGSDAIAARPGAGDAILHAASRPLRHDRARAFQHPQGVPVRLGDADEPHHERNQQDGDQRSPCGPHTQS